MRFTPTQLNSPVNQLRQEILIGLDQASNGLQQRIDAQSSFNPNGLIKGSIRIALSSLFYGAGFAFLAGFIPGSDRRARTGWLALASLQLLDPATPGLGSQSGTSGHVTDVQNNG